MIPTWVPLGEQTYYNQLWIIILDVFTRLGSPLFGNSWFRWLVLLMLLVWAAQFMWRWVRGLL